MWRNVALTIAALVTAVAGPCADLSEPFQSYFDGPETFLLTASERRAWRRIESNAEAARFITLFWARRDPNIDTPRNEFRSLFEMRVRRADELFTTAGKRGALSDRGRVFILLGAPGERRGGLRDRTRLATRQWGPTGGRSIVYRHDEISHDSYEVWAYHPAQLPMAGFDRRIVFVFSGRSTVVLARAHPANTLAPRVLRKARESYVFNPGLEEAPFSHPTSPWAGDPWTAESMLPPLPQEP